MSQAATNNNHGAKSREIHTDMKVGEILRRTRVHYGQSLHDVENILRIRAAQLQALEDDRPDLLPGRVYAIGFVRAYAEYLGLDGEKMVHLFKTQSGTTQRPRPERHFPVAASESKLPNAFILFSCLAGIALVIGALVMMTNGQGKTEPAGIPQVPQDLRAEELAKQEPARLAVAAPPVMGPVPPNAPVPQVVPGVQAIVPIPLPAGQGTVAQQAASPSAAAAPMAIAPAEPSQRELIIRITETAWVEIRGADGRALLSRVLKPGDSYTVPPGAGMVLDTGNIGGLEFVLNGAVLPPLGAKGDVRRRISLDPEKLAPLAASIAASIDPAGGVTARPASPPQE